MRKLKLFVALVCLPLRRLTTASPTHDPSIPNHHHHSATRRNPRRRLLPRRHDRRPRHPAPAHAQQQPQPPTIPSSPTCTPSRLQRCSTSTCAATATPADRASTGTSKPSYDVATRLVRLAELKTIASATADSPSSAAASAPMSPSSAAPKWTSAAAQSPSRPASITAA